MPVSVSYPGLYIEELPSSSHTITAAPTAITVFVGYVHPFQGECAQRNPPGWGKPIRIFNFADYERIFGGLYNNTVLGKSEVGYAVNQFFLNGGAEAYVVGLQPRYYELENLNNIAPITGAVSPAVSGIVFTAKELTDEHNQITVTIRNVRASVSTSPNDTADIMITYGGEVETYRGVAISAIDSRLRPSRLVTVAPQSTGGYPAAYTGAQQEVKLVDMPAPAFPTPPTHEATTSRMADFTEVFQADTPLDKLEIFNLLVVPGVADNSVWTAGLHFCQDKRAFFIMDPPARASADGMASLPTIEEIMGTNTIPNGVPNGALYFPYLKTIDPVTSDVIHLPPSGYVAGVYARTDTNRGVWKAPAGLETSLLNTTGVVDEGRMTDMRQGTVNQLGVNVLRSFPGSGTVVWGARTITQSSAFEQWRYVPVRRTALFIEQTLLRNLGWVVFEPNDEPLWSAIRLSVEGFMLSLFRQAAFQGSTPSQAFLVKCDSTTTRQVDIDNGKVNILVGFRPLKPAEFVIIQITQLAGQVQA